LAELDGPSFALQKTVNSETGAVKLNRRQRLESRPAITRLNATMGRMRGVKHPPRELMVAHAAQGIFLLQKDLHERGFSTS
jgi:hypothetical protein